MVRIRWTQACSDTDRWDTASLASWAQVLVQLFKITFRKNIYFIHNN